MERSGGHRAALGTAVVVGLAAVGNALGGASAGAAERHHDASASLGNVGSQSGALDLIDAESHWQLAGVTPYPAYHELAVANTNLSIVHQNGSPGYTEVPVNLYGTRLQTSGNFAVSVAMSAVNGAAEVNLDGQPPLVEDEFLAEEGTLALKISGNKFTATISDQQKGNNAAKASAKIKKAPSHTITVADNAGRLSFNVDNKPVKAQLADQGIFNSHSVWFGLDALTPGGSFVVKQLNASAPLGSSVQAVDTRSESITADPNGFAALAQESRPGFTVGAAVAPGPWVSDSTYRTLLRNYNGITTENAGKFQFVEPKPGYYNFADLDAIYAMAEKANMKVHLHTLVFGEANPAWLQEVAKTHPSQLKQIMIDYITTVVSRYKGKTYSIDVVDEPLADYGTTPGVDGLRKNIWYDAIGPNYIAIALEAAHTADPNAQLFINDFGMESDSTRFNQMVNLDKQLIAQGVYLTGDGFESHFDSGDTNASDTHVSIPMLESRFATLKALGLKARISELDVSSTSEYPAFGDAFTACLDSSNCESVTTWGMTNKDSSGGTISPRGKFTPGIGLPWDANEQPTAAVGYIKSSL